MNRIGPAFIFASAILLTSAPANADPLTSAYIDPASGFEWAQLTGTGGLTWDQLAVSCATDGTTACQSNLGGVELAGWTWATSDQVLAMFVSASDLTAAELADQDEMRANARWAAQLLALFSPNGFGPGFREIAGLVSDGPSFDPRGSWAPYVRDTANPSGPDQASRRRVLAKYDTGPGIWLHRTAKIPEPTTLALLALGLVGGVTARRFNRRDR